MKFHLVVPASVAAFLVLAPSALAGPGDLIVGVSAPSQAKALSGAKVKLERRLAPGIVLVDPIGSLSASAEAIKVSPGVDFVEPDRLVSTASPDPLRGGQWALDTIGASLPGASVVVAVIDSGVDYTHPDLKDQMWTNKSEIPANKIDDDQNGLVDDYYGGDWVQYDSDPMDYSSHGTHVAGIIAAKADNGIGIAGVAPSAKIMALRSLDASGSGNLSSAVSAINYAVDNGAKIINNSWGGDSYSQAMSNAITRAQQAGVLVVSSAGNNGRNLETFPFYPASYAQQSTLSVASSSKADLLSSFSNWGAKSVDLAAPGEDILSTVRGAKYVSMRGSSMSAPQVSGAAASLWGAYPSSSLRQVKEAILSGSLAKSSLATKTLSGKRLYLPGAASALASAPASPEELPLPVNLTAPSLAAPNKQGFVVCSPGQWEYSDSFSYTWFKNGRLVPGVTSANYPFVLSSGWFGGKGDIGAPLDCRVTANGPGGSETVSVKQSFYVALPPAAIKKPAVNGLGKVGKELYCSYGSWTTSGGTISFKYAWLSGGLVIPGKTIRTYVATAADLGKVVSCRVAASNQAGSTIIDAAGLKIGPASVR